MLKRGNPIAVTYRCEHVGEEEVYGGPQNEDERRKLCAGRLCPPCARAVSEAHAEKDRARLQVTGHAAHRRLTSLRARYRVCPEKCGPELLRYMAEESGNGLQQEKAAAFIVANEIPGYDWLVKARYPHALEAKA